MKLGQIIEFRTGNLKVATCRQNREQILRRIGALLRRRGPTPVTGCYVSIFFETEVEARALQKLIWALPRRRKPKVLNHQS